MCAPEPSATIKNVCPRCSNGRPICTDVKPDGSSYSHAETCAIYEWADDICLLCEVEIMHEAS